MPGFFFHFRQYGVMEKDAPGLEFPSAEAAYLGAFDAAREMWRELLLDRHDPAFCAFDMRDGDDRPLFELPFTEVREACDSLLAAPRKEIRIARLNIPVTQTTFAKRHGVFSEFEKARAHLEETMALITRLEQLSSI